MHLRWSILQQYFFNFKCIRVPSPQGVYIFQFLINLFA